MRKLSPSDLSQIEQAVSALRDDQTIPHVTIALRRETLFVKVETMEDASEETFDTLTVYRGETVDDVRRRVGYNDPKDVALRPQDWYVDPYVAGDENYAACYRRFDKLPPRWRSLLKYSRDHNQIVYLVLSGKWAEIGGAGLQALELRKDMPNVGSHRFSSRKQQALGAGPLKGLRRGVVRGARARRGRNLYD